MGFMPITVRTSPDDVMASTLTMPSGNVPSFGSFQPQNVVRTEEREPYDACDRQRTSVQKRKHSHREHAHRDHDRHRKDRQARPHGSGLSSFARHSKRHTKESEGLPIQETSFPETPLFVFDRFGDEQAAKYGASRHTLPKFHSGDGAQLGSRSMQNHLSAHSASGTISDQQNATPAASSKDDLIEIDEPQQERTHPSYRDPYGKLQQSPKKTDYTNLFEKGTLQDQSRDLHARIQRDPNDVNAWLELTQLQRNLLGQESSASSSEAHEATLARLQIAVLERAELDVTDNNKKHSVIQAKLYIAADAGVWSDEKLEQSWSSLLQSYPDGESATYSEYFQIWWSYIQYRKSNGASFTVDDMVSIYGKAFDAVVHCNELSGKTEQSIHISQTNLLHDLCVMLRSAGYPERAFGLLQAIVELHLAMLENSEDLDLSDEQIFEIFGAWWDAEHARIGDENYSSGFHLEEERQARCQAKTYLQESRAGSATDHPHSDTFENQSMAFWQRAEKESSTLTSPRMLKADIEAGTADPFSYVFFDDIRLGLFLPKKHAIASTLRVVDVLLDYLGLPSHWYASVMHFGQNNFEPAAEVRIQPQRDTLSLSSNMWREKQTMEPNFDKNLIQNVPLTPETLFPRTSLDPRGPWFAALPSISPSTAKKAERVLTQTKLRYSALEEERLVAMTTLAHAMLCVASGEPKSARKILREELQQNEANCYLWYAYAQLELSVWGNSSTARKVLVQVLGTLKRTSQGSDNYGSSLLWALWAELEWSTDNVKLCLAVLSAAAENRMDFADDLQTLQSRVPTNTELALLGTEKLQLLHSLRKVLHDACISHGHGENTIPSTAFCLVLAELLLQDVETGEELTAPISIFRSALNTPNMQVKQQIAFTAQKFLQLFRHKLPRTAFRPREVRAFTTQLAHENPHNSAHLHMLVIQEQSMRLENHVQQVIYDLLSQKGARGAWSHLLKSTGSLPEALANAEQTLLLAVFIQLGIANHSDPKRLRHILDKSLQSMRSSALLWHASIGFELYILNVPHEQHSKRIKLQALKRAKMLLYQAIRHCPYDKSLYLLAFEPVLGPIFDTHELYALALVMEEKQLRIFNDLVEPLSSDTLQNHYEELPDEDTTKDLISTFVDELAAQSFRESQNC